MRYPLNLISALSIWLFCGINGQAAAGTIAVPMTDASSAPTLTMHWESALSKSVLILIPGGDGQIRLKPNQSDHSSQFYQTLRQLTVGADPRELFDVVLFDSPVDLDAKTLRGRATVDHLSRIRSVIQFYSEKTSKPIWLMGHSNGAVSVTEYLRYVNKLGQRSPIAGLILSGASERTTVGEFPIVFPVLFLHHRKDSCDNTLPKYSVRNFEYVKSVNKAQTSFVYIEQGSPENKPICSSGYHMYNNATQEVVTAIRNFIVPYNR